MKKILTTSVIATLFASALIAGGDIAPIEPQVTTPEVTQTYFTGFYAGAGITANQTYLRGESDWFNDGTDSETGYGYNLITGYKFYNDGTYGVAVEARYGEGLWSNNGLDSKTYFAAIKPSYNFTDDISAYGLIGYGHSKVKDGSFKEQDSGFVYGVGAEYDVTSDISVFTDYVVNAPIKIQGDHIENDVITVGVNYHW